MHLQRTTLPYNSTKIGLFQFKIFFGALRAMNKLLEACTKSNLKPLVQLDRQRKTSSVAPFKAIYTASIEDHCSYDLVLNDYPVRYFYEIKPERTCFRTLWVSFRKKFLSVFNKFSCIFVFNQPEDTGNGHLSTNYWQYH